MDSWLEVEDTGEDHRKHLGELWDLKFFNLLAETELGCKVVDLVLIWNFERLGIFREIELQFDAKRDEEFPEVPPLLIAIIDLHKLVEQVKQLIDLVIDLVHLIVLIRTINLNGASEIELRVDAVSFQVSQVGQLRLHGSLGKLIVTQ